MLPEQIQTDRLLLRPFTLADVADVHEYWSSDSNWERFNASVPQDFTQEDAEQFVNEMIGRDRETQPSWAVLGESVVKGVVSLVFEQSHRIAVIGYGIHADLRGRGLSAEAARGVIAHAFEAYPHLNRIRAHTNSENIASQRVLEKLRFIKEGTLRENQFVKGQYQDEAIFGLLRKDFEKDSV